MSDNSLASLKGKSLLSLAPLSADQLLGLVNLANEYRDWRAAGCPQDKPELANRTVATIFEKRSTRTRVSMETATSLLKGHALFLSSSDIHLNHGEALRDTAQVLTRMCDVLFARVYDHNTLVEMDKYRHGQVPIINGLSDLCHPMQGLADLMTIISHFKGETKGLSIAWIGDGNNVLHSLLNSAPKLGINIRVCTPEKYPARADILEFAQECGKAAGASVMTTNDPMTAIKGANIIVTDTWISMGDESERDVRLKEFAGYQVTHEMATKGGAADNWIFMHCLPRHNEEVDDGVFYDEERSVVFTEAANRLYTAMAVLHTVCPDLPSV